MIAVGDKVNTFVGSVAVVLALNGSTATIEIISMNKGKHVNDRVFSGVPLWSLTKIG